MSKKVAEKGQALIELILANAIGTVLLSVLVTGAISAREAFARSDRVLDGNTLLQKEIEAVRSIKETGWNSLVAGNTYHTEPEQPPSYSWKAVPNPISENGFTRSFTVINVCRLDVSSSPVICSTPQAIVDPSTKEITATVSWSFLGTRSVSSTFFITRYYGNSTWVQTTQAHFNAGTHTNTVVNGDQVELTTGSGGNWNNPQVVATRDFTGTADATDVFVENNKAYVVSLTRTGADFFIYDVANPNNPSLLGSLDLAATGYAVVVSGNYAYVASSHDSRELTVIDVSNPSSPALAGSHFNAP